MKTFKFIIATAILGSLLLLVVFSSVSRTVKLAHPEKPFIIIEKSYGNVEGQPMYRYIYVSKNGCQRKFSELTEKYNIGDTIK